MGAVSVAAGCVMDGAVAGFRPANRSGQEAQLSRRTAQRPSGEKISKAVASPIRPAYPFSAIVGQDEMKRALMIAAVDPSIGGVLVFGDRGTGKSTTGTGTIRFSGFLPFGRALQCEQDASGAAGSQAKGQPATTAISGNSAARERTAVDLPVPRSPNTSTPPMLGSTAAIISARFISSCPTMALKG